MKKLIGTKIFGIRSKIINKNDDIIKTVVSSVLKAINKENIFINNGDIIGITESFVAKAQNNFINIKNVSFDLKQKFKNKKIGIVFPILSRNRFELILKSIAKTFNNIIVFFRFPSDEVGNSFISLKKFLFSYKNNLYNTTFNFKEFKNKFNLLPHSVTNVDYIKLYKKIIKKENCKFDFIFTNRIEVIKKYVNQVLICDIHNRKYLKEILIKKEKIKTVYSLDDILTKKNNNNGYNSEYGLLGSNKVSNKTLKLFPINCMKIAKKISEKFLIKTGKKIEIIIFGDGAYKDPNEKIWELADPVIAPGYTKKLKGFSYELKLKYLYDNINKIINNKNFKSINEKKKNKILISIIKNKSFFLNKKKQKFCLGTTPRPIVNLIGSLCDLVAGSGDKGTPIVLIQGYFDDYSKI